jgi:hypothetical protein
VFDRIEKEPTTFGKVEIRRVEPPADLALGRDGSADLVLVPQRPQLDGLRLRGQGL